jgi:hypothetical protein
LRSLTNRRAAVGERCIGRDRIGSDRIGRDRIGRIGRNGRSRRTGAQSSTRAGRKRIHLGDGSDCAKRCCGRTALAIAAGTSSSFGNFAVDRADARGNARVRVGERDRKSRTERRRDVRCDAPSAAWERDIDRTA